MRARATCSRCKRERYLDHLRPLVQLQPSKLVCKSEVGCR